MNANTLISRLNELILILSKLISELAYELTDNVAVEKGNNISLKISSKYPKRYKDLAELLNTKILPNKTKDNNKISTSELVNEILKEPKYIGKKEKTIIIYLYKINHSGLLDEKYIVENIGGKNHYYKK